MVGEGLIIEEVRFVHSTVQDYLRTLIGPGTKHFIWESFLSHAKLAQVCLTYLEFVFEHFNVYRLREGMQVQSTRRPVFGLSYQPGGRWQWGSGGCAPFFSVQKQEGLTAPNRRICQFESGPSFNERADTTSRYRQERVSKDLQTGLI